MHFSVARLMTAVLAMALGFAALRTASDTTMGITLLLTRTILGIAIVGAICCKGARRAFWLGFAICGLVYIRCSLERDNSWPSLPTHRILETLGRVMGVPIEFSHFQIFDKNPSASSLARSFLKIGHSLWALVFAALGGWLARLLFGAAADQTRDGSPGPPSMDETPAPRWWLQPLVQFLSALAIVSAIAIFGSRLTSGLWAGLTFFATCVLLAIALAGGLCGRGKRREAYLGAAVFGTWFLMLAFARSADDPWAVLPTVQLLEDAYPLVPIVSRELSASSDSTIAANARIRRALAKPIALGLSDEMNPEELLKQIQASMAEAAGRSIPVYIDPMGIAEAEKIVNTPASTAELGRVSLGSGLRRFLAQLDMAYVVNEGVLEITSRQTAINKLRSAAIDPYQVAGHCVLAMIAALLGGLAAPLVCGLAQ